MANQNKPAMRPLRLPGARSSGRQPGPLPPVPGLLPAHPVAPDWRSQTEDNGLLAPRADLHVALVAPDMATYKLLRKNVYVVTPPLWKDGRVRLHVILRPKVDKGLIPMAVLQAMADLGFVDAKDLEISLADMDLGYPSSEPQPAQPEMNL